jgi:putative membrane protein
MPLHAAIFAFLHHLAAFALVAVLVGEMLLLNSELNLANARRLQRLDAALGISASVLLIVGLVRVFYFEKGWEYYFDSFFFIAKLTLFLVVGTLSVVPTLEFLAWRKATNQGQAPTVAPDKLRRVRMIVHIELLGVVLIILCASLMAKTVQLF